ncbi:MAG: hypothetical protein ABIL09_17025, partial [Gemmatimonadota bacterium]
MDKPQIPAGMRLNFSRPDAKTILLVVDQAVARSTLKRNLEYYKFHVIDAPTPVEALKTFRDRPREFGLVLVDLTRPELPLEKVLQVLHSIDPKVKVAVCAEDTATGARAGGPEVVGVLRKPVRVDKLLSLMTKVLRGGPTKAAPGPGAPP